ncbi:lymphocyte cytosolic protein 2 isoform X2 [Amblyraja radiata]|uniref:lymphocyte cytosolic protein 2 isoform X2 n=1 Tax=Amblyraja radiata TaxID=386614 RepID=UPI001402E889|nr:lymphocyte cytosolic protein 2 isoform X2 [Amblyraja radiata]
MALRKVPNRNDVLQWSSAYLANYFRTLDWKDCEKVIKKNNINGQRFLNMSENDIQRFPTLRVPQIYQLCQEISKRDDKKSFFQKRNQSAIIQESSDPKRNEDLGWDSDEFTEDDDDDYEDPDQGHESADDDGDYESPNEEVEGHNSDNDYEPPPSNNEEAHQSKIFAAKPISNDSDYADKRTTLKAEGQPPLPPQRPGSVPIVPAGNKRSIPNMFSNLSVNEDPVQNKDRNFTTTAYIAPKVDRSRKPTLDQPGSERDSPSMVKKSPFPEKLCQQPPRPPFGNRLPDPIGRMPKAAIPGDRENSSLGRRQLSPRPCIPDRTLEEEDDGFSSRSFPRPVDSALNANTFPYRSSRPGPKPSFSGGNQLPLSNAESPSSGSLPPRFQQEAKQSFSRGPIDSRPPQPLPINKVRPPPEALPEEFLSREWYAGCINRSEADSALRSIDEDGTFLVRDSSRRNSEHPFVLMVLYGDKVYNVQIRYQENIAMYLLGTGLRGKENFSSVTELVEYHTQTALMLIDGKDQRGTQKKQCTLTCPAAQYTAN